MLELQRVSHTPRDQRAIVRLAERQWGVVAVTQLRRAGIGRMTTTRWVDGGRLHRLHRGVYAVGHRALSVEGRLVAALLYAGPGAMLSHVTAAWWWGIWGAEPRVIHVSTDRRRKSTTDVRVHGQRVVERTRHRHLPVTTVTQVLLDLAAVAGPNDLRKALADVEYQGLVDLASVEAETGRGRPGSAALREALAGHRPQLAHTLSVLEERFLELCEAHRIPLPQVNVKVAGMMVDALWSAERLIVELDGHRAHATARAVERDRRRELKLRAAGYVVLRYTWGQVTESPDLVADDVKRALCRC